MMRLEVMVRGLLLGLARAAAVAAAPALADELELEATLAANGAATAWLEMTSSKGHDVTVAVTGDCTGTMQIQVTRPDDGAAILDLPDGTLSCNGGTGDAKRVPGLVGAWDLRVVMVSGQTTGTAAVRITHRPLVD